MTTPSAVRHDADGAGGGGAGVGAGVGGGGTGGVTGIDAAQVLNA